MRIDFVVRTACAILLLAAAAPAFAQSTVPGAPPGATTRATPKIAAPPRAHDPSKFAVRPPAGNPSRPQPTPVDDIAGNGSGNTTKSQGGSTCYPDAGPNCVASLDKLCTKHGGGMRTNDDGSVTCVVN